MATSLHPCTYHTSIGVCAVAVGVCTPSFLSAAAAALVASGASFLPADEAWSLTSAAPPDTLAQSLQLDFSLEPPKVGSDGNEVDAYVPNRTVLRAYIGICDGATDVDPDELNRHIKNFVSDVKHYHGVHGTMVGAPEPVYRVFIFNPRDAHMDYADVYGPTTRFLDHDPSTACDEVLLEKLTACMTDIGQAMIEQMAAEEAAVQELEASVHRADSSSTTTLLQPCMRGPSMGNIHMALSHGIGSMSFGQKPHKRRLIGRLAKHRAHLMLQMGNPLTAATVLEGAISALKSTSDSLHLALALDLMASVVVAKEAAVRCKCPSQNAFLPAAASLLRDAVSHMDAMASVPEVAATSDTFAQLAVLLRLRCVSYLSTAPPMQALQALTLVSSTNEELFMPWWLQSSTTAAGGAADTGAAGSQASAVATVSAASRTSETGVGVGMGVSSSSSSVHGTSAEMLLPSPLYTTTQLASPSADGWARAREGAPGTPGTPSTPSMQPMTPSAALPSRGVSTPSERVSRAESVAGQRLACSGERWLEMQQHDNVHHMTHSGISFNTGTMPDSTSSIGSLTSTKGLQVAAASAAAAASSLMGRSPSASGSSSGFNSPDRFQVYNPRELLFAAIDKCKDVRTPLAAARLLLLCYIFCETLRERRHGDACVVRAARLLHSLQRPLPATAFTSPPTGSGRHAGAAASSACTTGCMYASLARAHTSGTHAGSGAAGGAAPHADAPTPMWPAPWLGVADVSPTTTPYRYLYAFSASMLTLSCAARDARVANMLTGVSKPVNARAAAAAASGAGAFSHSRILLSARNAATWLPTVAADLWQCGELHLLSMVVALLCALHSAGPSPPPPLFLPATTQSLASYADVPDASLRTSARSADAVASGAQPTSVTSTDLDTARARAASSSSASSVNSMSVGLSTEGSASVAHTRRVSGFGDGAVGAPVASTDEGVSDATAARIFSAAAPAMTFLRNRRLLGMSTTVGITLQCALPVALLLTRGATMSAFMTPLDALELLRYLDANSCEAAFAVAHTRHALGVAPRWRNHFHRFPAPYSLAYSLWHAPLCTAPTVSNAMSLPPLDATTSSAFTMPPGIARMPVHRGASEAAASAPTTKWHPQWFLRSLTNYMLLSASSLPVMPSAPGMPAPAAWCEEDQWCAATLPAPDVTTAVVNAAGGRPPPLARMRAYMSHATMYTLLRVEQMAWRGSGMQSALSLPTKVEPVPAYVGSVSKHFPADAAQLVSDLMVSGSVLSATPSIVTKLAGRAQGFLSPDIGGSPPGGMLASPSPHATSAEELSYCALPNVNKLQLELTLTSACDALLVGHASALLVCARASDVMSADSADADYPPPANESWWTSPSYFALEAGCSTPVGLPLTRTLAGCFITVQAVRVQVGGIAATYTIQRAPPITVVTAKDEVVARLHYPHGEYAGRNNTVVTAKPPRDWDAYIRPEMVSAAASARPSLAAGTLTSATTLESPGALSNAPTSRVRGAGFELQFPLPLYGSSWVIVDS